VVEPVAGWLELALGRTLAPAARQRRVALDLGQALRGEPLTAIAAEQLPPPGEVHFSQE
tara:strand:- start:1006 stop:1182 length:177 start_codon:yes stop_codon:yes gene_type:complete